MSLSLGSVQRGYWAGFLGLLIGFVLGLPRCGLGRWLYAVPLIMAGWYASVSRCSCRLACTLFAGTALYGTPALEFRDHTGSPAIQDGECGVMDTFFRKSTFGDFVRPGLRKQTHESSPIFHNSKSTK